MNWLAHFLAHLGETRSFAKAGYGICIIDGTGTKGFRFHIDSAWAKACMFYYRANRKESA